MSDFDQAKMQQLLVAIKLLGQSSEETTQTVQEIKLINTSLVDISKQQYQVVNQVFEDGEHIKTKLSESVNETDHSLAVLNETMTNMEIEFSHLEKSISLFDKISESTLSLNKVARHTKMLALNTSVLGGSLGIEGGAINIVAHEMQSLVKTCEEASKHIDQVVSSARNNLQAIVDINKVHIQASLENTAIVDKTLKNLIILFKGTKESDINRKQASVDTIISAVGSMEELAHQVTQIVNDTKSKTDVLNNEVEVSNQAVSDLLGVVTNTPITNLSPTEANERIPSFRVIDVRRKDEFNDSLGHISNAKLCPINETDFKNKLDSLNKNSNYLFVCRSGGRSSRATRIAQSLGFTHIYNLKGGMLAWDKGHLPVERI